jgi:hypothetical protein
MSRPRAFLAVLHDFVVGDDATIAIAVVVAIALTAAIAALGLPAWWALPTTVIAALARSLKRTIRTAQANDRR